MAEHRRHFSIQTNLRKWAFEMEPEIANDLAAELVRVNEALGLHDNVTINVDVMIAEIRRLRGYADPCPLGSIVDIVCGRCLGADNECLALKKGL
jgi:hypothetical protein